jgi:hypothetical protein
LSGGMLPSSSEWEVRAVIGAHLRSVADPGAA